MNCLTNQMVYDIQGTHKGTFGAKFTMGDECKQRPSLEWTSAMENGSTGDGQVIGTGLCFAGHQFTTLSNVSLIIKTALVREHSSSNLHNLQVPVGFCWRCE